MAGADTHKRVQHLKDVEVPEWMIKGNKFIKWEEESSTATPVTLRVDKHGHFLYWKNQTKDTDCLELTSLRDTRYGKYANVPKDGKLRETCVMGSPDTPLEDKTLTIVHGSDMVNNNTLNFCSNSEKLTQEWADMILKIGYHRSAQYPSPYKLLEKIYTRLTIMVNKEGKVPLKSIKKMFASSREDKKKVENALQAAGLHLDKKDDSITPDSFRIEDFFTFYTRLISQKEIDKVFQGLGAKNKPYLTTQQVIKFLNDEQRDPRLNEILYPFYDVPRAKELVNEFEPNKAFMKKGQLSVDGLLRYLLSEKNSIVGPDAYLLCDDMEQPISHYFINSSHNTYLTGHQLTGKSSVEMYRQALLCGCRCVELDCWDGKTAEEEPIITHGFTMCTEVSFKEVIEAIKETAFKTTDFPVILSFENHCGPKQQAKMANYCRTIFGEALLVDTLEANPIEVGVSLPSPNALRGKILVKNKKRRVIDGAKKRSAQKKAAKEGERKGRGRLTSASSFSSHSSFDNNDDDFDFLPSHRTSRRGTGRRLNSQSSIDSEVSVSETAKITRGVSRKASKRSQLLQIDEKDNDLFSSEDHEVSVVSNKLRRESQTLSPNMDGEVSSKRRESQSSKRSSIDSTNGEVLTRHRESCSKEPSERPIVEGQINKIRESPSASPRPSPMPSPKPSPKPSPRPSPRPSPKLPKKDEEGGETLNMSRAKDENTNRKASTEIAPNAAPESQPKRVISLGRSASIPATKTFSTDSERSVDSSMSKTPSDTLDEVEEESDSDDDEENMSKEEAQRHQMEKREKGTAGQEAEAGREMSALVNYIQPVHFHTFEAAEKRNRSYEISSFVETSAMNRVKENPIQFTNYNKRQLSRIYPRGTRVDSSNYMPQIFWNVGCQMVALNYQTLDLPMQLNMGYFEINGRTGYILKPEFMRRKDRLFDPFAESTMDGVVAATVEVRVISGQFLSDRRVHTYVEVDMFGLPADTVRRRYKTKSQTSNSINPVFDGNPFVFKKVIMPELAMLRIAVFEDNGKMVGHRILPVESLRPGYRHLFLCNESNQPLMLPTLFLNIKVRDYVPERMTNFADALANPIAYQSKEEKRAAQLKALEEEEEVKQVKSQEQATEEQENGDDDTPDQPSAERRVSPAPAPSPAGTTTGPGNYRKNTIPSVESNGLKQNAKLQTSLAAITPSSSFGDSLPIPRTRSLGTAQFQMESLGAPLNQNNRSISAPNLGQSEEIQAARLEDIKDHKKYKKVVMRLNQELEKLIKKEEKKQSKMKRTHDKDLVKMKKNHQKAFKSLTKKQSSQLKKAAKKGQNIDEMRQQLNEVMDALTRDKENEILKKQAAQETALIELYKKHFADERDLKKEHAEILYELQMELMVAVHEKQLGKLDSQHKKEEVDLRKRLDEKNAEDLKQMSKRRGDKQEMSRLRRENQQKYIQQAVLSRQTLHEIQQKKREELETQMKELQEELAAEEDTHAASLDAEYETKCRQLLNDLKNNQSSSGGGPVIIAHSNGVATSQEQVGVVGVNGGVEVEAVIETNPEGRSDETGEIDPPCPVKAVQSSSSSSSQDSPEEQGSSSPKSVGGSHPPSPTKSAESPSGRSPRKKPVPTPEGSPKKSPVKTTPGEGLPTENAVDTPQGSPTKSAIESPEGSPKKAPVKTPERSPVKAADEIPAGLSSPSKGGGKVKASSQINGTEEPELTASPVGEPARRSLDMSNGEPEFITRL
ncbi:1-phosphatidylinositol 4,5-bisphosphate phosphodiesterase beta-1-like isoform X3 [Patiria miniata]|uniref:Phosphoinositide phospholipase C n=1 Tax=Patiria miniata TaxID=46514 RepID=A0A914B5Z1_PATMI|nr:1-phosphatidylinositol 4,5-bisphosphate phosphodiesterase beta-1-like isoform X3 [Patiria miniata]